MKITHILTTTITIIVLNSCSNSNLTSTIGVGALKVFSVSNSQIKSVARETAIGLDRKNRVALPNSTYTKRLKHITSNLRLPNNNLHMNYKVYLSPQVNAFALADGSVRVYSRLMDIMNDDELKFVIGHEIGHVKYHHHKKSYQMALATKTIREAISKGNNNLGTMANSEIGTLAEKLINAQYSQKEEKEADLYGLKVLYANGANPLASITALKKVAKIGGGGGLFSDHPAPMDRIATLKAKIKN